MWTPDIGGEEKRPGTNVPCIAIMAFWVQCLGGSLHMRIRSLDTYHSAFLHQLICGVWIVYTTDCNRMKGLLPPHSTTMLSVSLCTYRLFSFPCLPSTSTIMSSSSSKCFRLLCKFVDSSFRTENRQIDRTALLAASRNTCLGANVRCSSSQAEFP